MNDFIPGTSCIEGLHRFVFESGYEVCRFECSPFYSHHAQNFGGSCKEMDFVLYHPGKKELWLIEVKDYRFNARPKVRELVEKLCRKVRDCLFLLRTAALCAPEEEPAEGISLRNMARKSLLAKHIRVAFTIELPMMADLSAKSLLVSIHDLLYRQIRFIDPHMVCQAITAPYSPACPWRVYPAGNEHSARIQKRIEEARLARENEAKRQRELQRHREREAAKKQRRKRKSTLPLWKQRAQEREEGKSGTHADRKRDGDK